MWVSEKPGSTCLPSRSMISSQFWVRASWSVPRNTMVSFSTPTASQRRMGRAIESTLPWHQSLRMSVSSRVLVVPIIQDS